MPGTIYLPESARAYAQARSGHSEVSAENRQLLEEFDRVQGALEYWENLLRSEIDDHLRIVMAKPNVTVDGLKPGYYHIVRIRPGTMAYIKPVENPDGTWRDLDSYVLTLAAEDDLWNDQLHKARHKMRKDAEAARQRQADREAQDRAAEFDDRLKHATNVQILVPRNMK